ncbi:MULTISPECIES: enoyl-CoA hydratase/isomerase family protein [unclassified Novosphingobium]|uniref:enoyl-CoA hydratase/isomerase family protein n=1 Tax=unclassified Novosphingobium TaxID=2644732 RepID=UPI000D2FE56F|nr:MULTISPECIES: enoyl-CoA hydratase-related protein [unclassified Novosphingobium]PTR05820.1 enoyl-CoA hydratase [Novosphingobium sp. GV055]PUA94379.1 enoyl-CoA hydratase [Novosphingobium sp. GV061]PUB12685.1 enoyl-CoA hydratase [Novosphingobium sp. GV079]PUB38050.1 enoyl-CoA hydratase [Novosphingobium sp. GV027]
MSELVKLKVENGLARISLARPESGNAMSRDFIESLVHACETVMADSSVRAVLLNAEGKNFCVGGDINAFAEQGAPGAFIEHLAERLHQGMKCLASINAPVVVAVRGAAAGAGFSLAAAGDIVLAGEGASFTLAYPGIGLTSDGGATWSLPRLIGLRRTQELAYLNRRLSAADALEWGLVTRVVADDVVEAEALQIAERLAQGPTRAFGGIKHLLSQSFSASYEDHLDVEAKAIGSAMDTVDAQSAVQAFLARQKPKFTGE